VHHLRRELSLWRIRVVDEKQVDLVLNHHHFAYRGYEDELGHVREVMRSEISVRLASYFAEISSWLTEVDKHGSGK
jgi:predicted metallo-beta-lactamase superfamily hydrolase